AAALTLLGTGREHELEAAPALRRGLEPDSPTERGRQLTRDREPQPRAAAVARPEGTEDPLPLHGRDPRAAVVDRDVDGPIRRAQLELDPAAVGRPAEGVGEQVRDDLEDAVAVRDEHRIRRDRL